MDNLGSHVAYEIDMVRMTWEKLPYVLSRDAHLSGFVDQVIINAVIESFWVHVSCLAKHIGIWDLNGHPLWRQIEEQILTIGEQRSNVLAEKLNHRDMEIAVQLLESAGISILKG